MTANPMEIPFDLCMRNLIATCLEFDNAEALYQRAEYFLEIIFSQDATPHYQSLLMGLFDTICDMDRPLQQYSKFFLNTNSAFTTFAIPITNARWAYQSIPLNGDKVQIIMNTDEMQDKYE